MIARLEGPVVDKEADALIIMTGGFGVRVYVTQPCLSDTVIGEVVTLLTHLVVREDLLALYGFRDREEQDFFNLLIGVSGVGPKLALGILSNASTDLIRRAVVQEQPDYLARVPGVGKKTAQKIVLHLTGKIRETGAEGDGLASIRSSDYEVIEALTALGYSIVQAQTAVQALPKDMPDDVEEKLRVALQSLA